jgi:hypothetical protein
MPPEQTVGAGGSAHYQAIGTLSDGTSVDMTHSVGWTVASQSESTMIAPGVVQVLTATTTTVYAVSGQLTATASPVVR